jgi:hypothetical protein
LIAALLFSMPLPPLVFAQTSDAASGRNLNEEMKWFAGVVEGATAELGIKRTNYDSYRYENVHYDGCTVRWRETRKFYENRKLTLTTIDDVTIPLGSLSVASVRVDKLSASIYKVSFTAIKPNPLIGYQQKLTYADGREESAFGGREDYGMLFRNISDARRARLAFLLGINSCQTGKES